jgi:hypothetical protein
MGGRLFLMDLPSILCRRAGRVVPQSFWLLRTLQSESCTLDSKELISLTQFHPILLPQAYDLEKFDISRVPTLEEQTAAADKEPEGTFGFEQIK